MGAPGVIDTPQTEHLTESSIEMEADFGSRMESFTSPGGDDILQAVNSKRRNRRSEMTPARQVFGSLANRGGPGKNEFTPLLKSVQRSNLTRKVSNNGAPPTPAFLRNGKLNTTDSPALPQAGSSDIGDSTYQTREDETTIGPAGIPSSSVNSTPLAPIPRGKGGVLEHDGQMTLREQEKIIDDIKKENFGLKLKIVFMEQRLQKLGPEHHEEAIKENIDIKVERATLKAELKRYRKSLTDSEKAIAELREQMMKMQSGKQAKYTDDRKSEEQARVLQEAQEKLDAKEQEIQQILEENERLREEAGEYKSRLESLEEEDNDELERLREQVDKLEGEKGDLEAELNEKERALDEREEQMEGVEEHIEARDERIKDLEQEAEAFQEKVTTLERELEGRVSDRDGALARKDEALRQTEQTIKEMEREMLNLQNTLDDAKAGKLELIKTKERVEAENHQLDSENRNLNIEKHNLQNEVEELKDDIRNRSFTYKDSIGAREGQYLELENQLEHIRQEYNDLQQSHQEKSEEVERLKARLNERDGDIEGEFATLQKQIGNLKREREGAVRSRTELETELRKAKTDLHNLTSEKDLLHMRHDALTNETQDLQKQVEKLKLSVQETNVALQTERQLAASNEQALREEWEDDKNALNDELDQLEREVREKESRHERAVSDWNAEKRQLEAKIQKAEVTAEGLKKTIENLQQVEHTIQGKEAKLHNALKSENERHKAEEDALNRQIAELQDEIEDRKAAFDLKAAELNAAKEELRVAKKAEKVMDEKVKALDDEIELLSAQLDEVNEEAEEQINTARADVETLRQKLNAARLELTRLENQHASARADIQTYKGDLEAEASAQGQLKADLRDANRRLETVQKDKQNLQEKLAKVNSQIHTLKTTSMEIESERDELKSQLQQLSHQVDVTKGYDQEKMELRKSKNKLEHNLQRVSDERELLEQKASELEAQLEDALDSAQKLEDKLEKQTRELKAQLKSITDGRDHDQQTAQRNIARLESRVEQLLKVDRQDGGGSDVELKVLRAELAESRKRENEAIQKESANRKAARELRSQIDKLEGELMEAKNAAVASRSPNGRSPRSSRKSEVDELKRQLASANEQVREFRSQTRSLQRKVDDQKTSNEQVEYEKSLLEQEINEIRESNDALVAKNLQASTTIGDLRKRIHTLERELHDAQLNKHLKNSEVTRTAQQEVAEERQELHDHIKSATLEIEQLQSQLNTREEEIRNRRKREKELDAQIRSLRKERQQQDTQYTNINEELKKITRRYQRAIERTAQLQAAWDEERKAIKQRVRFSESTSRRENAKTGSEVKALEKIAQDADERHRAEIKGLAKQIRYLRAKVARESGFRADLSFSKNFFLMQINLYSACNEANMQLIEQMGIFPDRYIREKRPALRSVVQTIIATIRMSKLQRSWSANKELKTSLVKSLERVRRMENVGGLEI